MSKRQSQKTQSQCLWFDVDNNKHYLLNNETGEMTHVNKTGDWIKEFDASLTGSVGYNERVERAQNNPGYMPLEAKCLDFSKNSALYTPQNSKLEGYTQLPNPRTQPYYNREHEFKLNRKKKIQIKSQINALNLENTSNSSTFQYQGTKRHNLGVSFLTGTMKTQSDVQREGQIKIFKERQIKPDYKKIDPNTYFSKTTKNSDNSEDKNQNEQENNTKQEKEKIPFQSQKKLSADTIPIIGNTMPVMVINDRQIEAPFTKTLQRTLNRTQSLVNNSLLSKQKDIDLEEEMKKHRISQLRYTNKVTSVSGKTLSYMTLPKDSSTLISQYFTQERKRERNLNDISTKFNGLETKTFDKSIKLNLPKSQSTPRVQTIDNFQTILNRKQKELEGFKIPEQKEKQTVVTQGRFSNVIISQDAQFHKDRDLIMKNFAEETVEKINMKKVKLENMRRDLLRKVLSEQQMNSEKKDSENCRKIWRQTNKYEVY